ncbi:MAG TPA: hypothetical protein VL371_12790, partial [Gemmataceae bacterium]|nr:hypothetical protein [Gemmataceae bacterium]
EDQADLDVVEEAELEAEDEAIEDAIDAEAEASDEERPAREHREDGERGGRRGRRRRGGRNRNRRDRDSRDGGQPREAQHDDGEQPAAAGEARGDGEFAAGPEDMAEGGEQFANGSQNGQNDERGPRRRRRRRGRRGGNRDRFQGGENHPVAAPADDAPNGAESGGPLPPVSQTPAAFDADRFGHVEEIDTTPRDEPVRTATPNTASSPSWSLNDPHEIDTTPKPAETAATSEPAAPPKKGWWQRAFKSD